jgi:hypothetical protein
MSVRFSVARSAGGDVLRGNAGDWLVQYAPGAFAPHGPQGPVTRFGHYLLR